MKRQPAINELLKIMARLRAPNGCPWDREQDHRSLRWHAVEEVYELIDAIESADDHELEEELGDLLLQVVFHCQLAKERGAFDFEKVARHIVDKLIRRHPHVFGELKVKDVDQVWANWEKIKTPAGLAARREADEEGAAGRAGNRNASDHQAHSRSFGRRTLRVGPSRTQSRLVSRGIVALRDPQAGARLAESGSQVRAGIGGITRVTRSCRAFQVAFLPCPAESKVRFPGRQECLPCDFGYWKLTSSIWSANFPAGNPAPINRPARSWQSYPLNCDNLKVNCFHSVPGTNFWASAA